MRNISGNKTLAKNTIYLSIRMLVVILINLYCSRVILKQLGFADYGVYNIVAGVVILISFLHNALSGASSRFIIYEIGKSTDADINTVFNTTLYVHIAIVIFLVIVAIIFGSFFLEYYLNIPPARLDTAKNVFYFSVATAAINTLYIPFEALLFAYEKFKIYAISSVGEAIGKLFAAVLIIFSLFADKLLWYGILVFVAVLCTKVTVILYIRAKLATGIKIGSFVRKSSFQPVITFFGWDIYGNFSLVLKDQGINILLNIFFGPLLNAANGIAQQVHVAVGTFSNSFLMAIKPQIIKNYAVNDLPEMIQLIYKSSKFSFFILLFLSLPLFFEIEFILKLWLIQVPAFTAEFCQYIILINLITGTMQSINYSIHATGKIKLLSFLSGTIFMLIVPVVYLGFYFNMSAAFCYAVVLIFTLIAAFINIKILQKYITRFSLRDFFSAVIIKCILVGGTSTISLAFLHYFIFADVTWLRLVQLLLIAPCVIICSIYMLGLNRDERQLVKSFVKKRL